MRLRGNDTLHGTIKLLQELTHKLFKRADFSSSEVFPKTEIQLCVVHQIRNSLKYVVSRDQKAFMQDLKRVYKATSKELAEHHLLELGEKWGKKYPAVIKSWQDHWETLS